MAATRQVWTTRNARTPPPLGLSGYMTPQRRVGRATMESVAEPLACPRCEVPLAQGFEKGAVHWICEHCRGGGLTVIALRHRVESEQVNALWGEVRHSEQPSSRACPICRRMMSAITVKVPDASVDLDACRECQFIWFDSGEYETLPVASTDRVNSLTKASIPGNQSIEDLLFAATRRTEPDPGPSELEPDWANLAMTAYAIIRLFARF